MIHISVQPNAEPSGSQHPTPQGFDEGEGSGSGEGKSEDTG